MVSPYSLAMLRIKIHRPTRYLTNGARQVKTNLWFIAAPASKSQSPEGFRSPNHSAGGTTSRRRQAWEGVERNGRGGSTPRHRLEDACPRNSRSGPAHRGTDDRASRHTILG